jgi:hypothetical protein
MVFCEAVVPRQPLAWCADRLQDTSALSQPTVLDVFKLGLFLAAGSERFVFLSLCSLCGK